MGRAAPQARAHPLTAARILALALCAACGGGGEYPPPDPLPAEYTACEVVDDCVVVELGCCDACNGGLAVAVREDQAPEVQDRYSERCGNRVDCTLMGCPPWLVSCTDGTCALERGTFSSY